MKCTNCGGECRIAPEQVGLDERDIPVYHRYAYCDKCMIKWNIDVITRDSEKPNENKWSVLKVCGSVLLIVVVLVMIGRERDRRDAERDLEERQSNVESYTTNNEVEEYVSTDAGLMKYETGEYRYITSDDLNKYAVNMSGVKIYTVVEISDIKEGRIQSNISDKFMLSDFYLNENINDYNVLEKGDVIAVLGEVEGIDDYGFMGNRINVNNCFVFAVGEDVAEYQRENSDVSLAEYFVVTEAVANAGLKLSEEEYKALCDELSHNDILRNPDNFDGKYCKLSGKVDQVVEGWFGSFTFYISDSSGNKWGTTYSYKDGESHILEGDNIIIYGKCNGTATVDTVLGKQVTLPYISIEYIETN